MISRKAIDLFGKKKEIQEEIDIFYMDIAALFKKLLKILF